MDYFRIRQVSSFDALVTAPFVDGVNAVCWQRDLAGDFDEVVAALAPQDDMIGLDETALRQLQRGLSPAGQAAIDAMLGDLRLLEAHGLDPVLDCIPAYPRDETAGVMCTDVYSFHVDRAPVEAYTYLCTYTGASSQGVANEDVTRRIDDPQILQQVRAAFARDGGDDFDAFVRDHSYDLHYAVNDTARPYSFGRCNLWRIAIAWPGAQVPPCIHRAPETNPGDPPRLLLIS